MIRRVEEHLWEALMPITAQLNIAMLFAVFTFVGAIVFGVF